MTPFVLLITSVLTFPNGVQIHDTKTVSPIESPGQCEMLKPEFEDLAYSRQLTLETYYGLETEMELDMECLAIDQLEALARERREAMK